MSVSADTLAGDLLASFALALARAAHTWDAAHESDRLTSIELGSGREEVLEDPRTECPRDAREQVGLASTLRWPQAQSRASPQPVGGTQRGSGLPRISLRERELRRGDEREGHALDAKLHGLARVHRLHQQRTGLVEAAGPHGKRGELRSCTRLEPVVAE